MGDMAEQISGMDNIIKNLSEIQEDTSVPKNVRIKVEAIANTLKEDTELSIRINKALNELDGLASDANLQPYTRTQIWNVMSVLEKL